MKYKATGASRTDGQDVTLMIEAKNPGDAQAIAMRSMLVSSVEPESEVPALGYQTPGPPAPILPPAVTEVRITSISSEAGIRLGLYVALGFVLFSALCGIVAALIGILLTVLGPHH